jgi:RNA-directed DNA polymerase
MVKNKANLSVSPSGDIHLLNQRGLPVFANDEEIASAMGMTVGKLHFLTATNPYYARSHYRQFSMDKKLGSYRTISVPLPCLKNVQTWILERILNGCGSFQKMIR